MSVAQSVLFLIVSIMAVGFMAVADHYYTKYTNLRRQLDMLVQKDGFAYRKYLAQPVTFKEL